MSSLRYAWILALMVGSFSLNNIANGQITILDFDNYTTGGNVAAWADPGVTFTSDPTNWTVDVPAGLGFGFHFDDIADPPGGGLFDISSETTLELDYTVNSGGAGGTQVLVVLEDFFGNQSIYSAPAVGTGNQLFSIPLASPTGTNGTPADLTDLNLIQLQGNSFPSPASGYSITFNDLSATTPAPPDPTVVYDFNGIGLAGAFSGWDASNGGAVTIGPDSLNIQADGFGSGFAATAPALDATGNTHVELDLTVNSTDGPVNAIVLLEDADGTQNVFRWFDLDAGNHLLSFRLETITNADAAETPNGIDSANSWQGIFNDSTPGDLTDNDVLDLANINFFQIQIDPQQGAPDNSYDVDFNNIRVKNIPGGFDTDEDSDVRDLLVWQRGLTPNNGSAADLMEWRDNFGNGEAIASPVSAVPEPGSAALACILAATLVSLRRRSS